MAGPTAEQVLAVNALLQQALQKMEVQNAQLTQQLFPVSVQNSNLGLNLATLTRALTIEGTAVAVNNLDQLIVKTASGEVVLKVQNAAEQQLLNLLPTRVTLQLRPGPDGLQAVLVMGNRAMIPDKSAETVATGTTMGGNQTLAPQIPKINQISQALVLPSSLFSAHTPEEFLAHLGAQVKGAPLPAGTPQQSQTQTFVSTILQRLGFTPAPQPNAPALPPPVPQIPAQMVMAPSLRGLSAPLLDAPKITAIKILGMVDTAQKAQTTTGTAPAALAAMTEGDEEQIATVRGNTPSGQPVLSVGDKFMAVQGAKNWPVGMQLRVLVGASAGLALDMPEGAADTRGLTMIRQVLEALATLSPAAYNDVARLRVPQANAAQMPGALLFLFNALQKGVPGWLGEEVAEKMKEMGKEGLIRALGDQWRAQMGQEAEGPGGQWRGVSIPVFDQQRLNHLRMYVYDPPDQRGQGKGKRDPNHARRFLIDFQLTKLGPIQLDGLVHKKRLDLVVRTAHAFENQLQNELVSHFNRTLEEVRYAGQLSFVANRTGWVEMRNKPASPVTQRI